jgi:hypothetical protein
VKKRHAEPLHGDWSLEKLTRYIDKNMPEDAPGKCQGKEAAAVARFIYDAFYSPEARLRLHPPRVELARLTNRQYAQTIADLLKSFTGLDAVIGEERGLQATYRGARANGAGAPETNSNKGPIERIDRGVEFDFLREGVTPQAGPTNEFRVQWHGSVLAEETGEYEFILRTPNGARLWINNERETLLDASVVSGKAEEHRATLRLLGGRAYPLRLEWFKAPKDNAAQVALHWKPPRGVSELIPARCLTPSRTTPTFVVTTAFPPDDSSVGYERGVGVSKEWDEATTQAAIEVAGHVVGQLDRFARTQNDATNRAARVQEFCEEFVAAAFRRPLTVEQKRAFVLAPFKAGGGRSAKLEDAVKRVVLRTLKSPGFLYLGLENGAPDSFEVAARLSFALWDSIPDAALRQAAARGQLVSAAETAAQAQRMLRDPRSRSKVRSFLHHWLQVNHAESLAKDDQLFPGFSPEVIADLRTSLNLFLDDVVWSDSSDYRRLLLEDDLYVNNRLAQFYHIETNAADSFVKVSIEPKQRAGVLTHPYLLASFSYARTTSPIHRGVFLTRNIIGRALKPPPMAMAFRDADFAPTMTMREKVAELTRPQACQSCHSVINPLGFSLEQFDAVGRLRSQEGERSIDITSEYVADDGRTVKLDGARDVALFALASEHAQEGFIEQLFHHAVKQPVAAYGADVMDTLRESFVASGYNIQKLLVEIATVSARHGLGPALSHSKPKTTS